MESTIDLESFFRKVISPTAGGIVSCDEQGRIVFATEGIEHTLGYDAEELVGVPIASLFPDGSLASLDGLRAAVGSDGLVSTVRPLVGSDGEASPVALTVGAVGWDGEEYLTLTLHGADSGESRGGSVGAVGDVPGRDVDRTRALLAASASLSRSSEPGEIASDALDALTETLGHDVGCIRRYDEASERLEVMALTDRAATLVDSRPAFDLDATLAGRAYRQQASVTGRCDALGGEDGSGPETTFHAPIGEWGVLTLLSRAETGLSAGDAALVEALATVLGAHFERARRDHRRQERLDRLDATLTLARLVLGLVDDVVSAGTRQEVEHLVCDRLTASEHVHGAWFAENDLTGDGITVTAWSGVEPAYLRLVETMAESGVGDEAARRTIESGRVTITDDAVQPANAAVEESVPTAMVPVVRGNHVYGVLAIHPATATLFDGEAEPMLGTLGRTLGFALQSVAASESLLSDRLVELKFDVSDAGCFVVEVSAELGCRCRVERGVFVADDGGEGIRCYLRVEGVSTERARDALDERADVREARVVRSGDDEGLLEIVRTDLGPTAQFLRDAGASIREATADHGEGTLIVQVSRAADIRRLVDVVQSGYPGSKLVAKRELDGESRGPMDPWEQLSEQLTDKQKIALETACANGYYEWPRESTAEEIAESMGISSATLHQHLRRGEQKILSVFLEEMR